MMYEKEIKDKEERFCQELTELGSVLIWKWANDEDLRATRVFGKTYDTRTKRIWLTQKWSSRRFGREQL